MDKQQYIDRLNEIMVSVKTLWGDDTPNWCSYSKGEVVDIVCSSIEMIENGTLENVSVEHLEQISQKYYDGAWDREAPQAVTTTYEILHEYVESILNSRQSTSVFIEYECNVNGVRYERTQAIAFSVKRSARVILSALEDFNIDVNPLGNELHINVCKENEALELEKIILML